MNLIYLRAASTWTPARLFAASEVGGWYDPSDFSSMFQDENAATPVTATGQSVALWFGKGSEASAIGSQLLTNGDFSGGSTGWTTSGGWSITGGGLVGSSASNSARQNGVCVSGQRYFLTFDVTAFTSGAKIRACNTIGVELATTKTITGTGTFSIEFVATGTDLFIEASTDTFSGTLDNFVLRRIYGPAFYQSSSSLRPVLQQEAGGQYYLSFDGTDDVMYSNEFIKFTFAQVHALWAGVRYSIGSNTNVAILNAGNLPTDSTVRYGFDLYNDGSAIRVRSTYPSIDSFPTGLTLAATPATAIVGQERFSGSLVTQYNNASTTQDITTSSANFTEPNYLWIGRHRNSSQYANMRLYGLVMRGTSNSAGERSSLQTWLANKSGVTL